MKKAALLIIFFLLSTLYFLSSADFVNAASQTTNYPAPNTNPDVQNNLHNWTQSVMIEVMSSLTCQIAGVDPINPKQSCLGADQATGKIGFLPSAKSGGAIGFMGNMISVLYTPPLHTSDYFQNLAQNFGITKHALAAPSTGGTGFQSLTPLIGIWSAFRNIVYLILVIVFVVIGLAIMLRVKIDPRTVMTIQNQIPKIIVGILAVTFSFAIAGFLIDLMWVLIYLIYGIISGISPEIANNVDKLNPTIIQGKDAISAVGGIWGIGGIANNVSQAVGNIISFSLFGTDSTTVTATVSVASIILALIGSFFGPIGTLIGGAPILILAVGAIIVYLIIFVALLTALFRLWFMLLMSYVYILLDVVLAPFWIIGGIIPGSSISISGWFKDIGANLLAFPATIGMFMLGKVFMDAFGKPSTNPTQSFVPPLIGNPGNLNLLGSLISLGIILMTPNVVNMLKAMLKAPKIDTGIGKALAPGLGAPGRIVGGGLGYAFGVHYEQVPGRAPGQVQMVARGGAPGRILRALHLVS
ncbi:MAG: hypothetical protein HW400_484 [Candidatus Levybacteria bacterium]|nr:hypothetical protein [Candidatus Levybacteria bacterium]